MATSPSSFFVGMGTTFAILAAGFGGGLMFAKSAMEAPTSVSRRHPAEELPAARVVLSTTAEAATPKEHPVASIPPADAAPVPAVVPPPEVRQTAEKEKEKDKQAERAERRKAEADERAHRKRVAERKARREAARIAQHDERQQRQQPGIMAFDDEQPRSGSFFGN